MTALWLWAERRLGAANAALLVFLLALVATWAINTAWHRMSAAYWRGEAAAANRAANAASANAASANAGAHNASQTRRAIDIRVAEIHDTTEAAANRVQSDDDRPVDAADRSPFDADSLRELEAAQHRARAAADRLRGAR